MSRRDERGLVTVETGQKITFNPPYDPATETCTCSGSCPDCGRAR